MYQSTTSQNVNQNFGMVKFTHNVAKGPNVDIYANSKKILSNIPYKAISGNMSFNVGQTNFQVMVSGTQNVVAQTNFNVINKASTNMIVHGDVNNLASIKIWPLNDTSKCATDFSQIRFAHAAAGAPPVDVYLNQIKAFSNVAYGQVGKPEYVKFNCGKITVTIKPAGMNDVVFETKYDTVCGENYTVIASGIVGEKAGYGTNLGNAFNNLGNAIVAPFKPQNYSQNQVLTSTGNTATSTGNTATSTVNPTASTSAPFTLLKTTDNQYWCIHV